MISGSDFTMRTKRIIMSIPKGKVCTYGLIATVAGSPRGARQVVRVLHTASKKERLPWHRVINSQGKIGLPRGFGYEEQRGRLEEEGVVFKLNGSVDLDRFLWVPSE